MYTNAIVDSLVFKLNNIAFLHFKREEVYHNVISPFSRMYLITEGEGHITIGGDKIMLSSGNTYLIPSFTPCTYLFYAGLSHYYVHFDISIHNHLNIYSLYNINNSVSSLDLVNKLFSRLLEINPNLELPHHDPEIYQNKPWIDKKTDYKSIVHHLETIGIISQLFSRFIVPKQNFTADMLLRYNIQSILRHIQENMANEVSIDDLACMACLSKDHFTRIFKSLLGMPPCEYIIRKRIEKAQLLLLTTNLSHTHIMTEAGFNNISYFSRVFKKYTSFTPATYRRLRG